MKIKAAKIAAATAAATSSFQKPTTVATNIQATADITATLVINPAISRNKA